MLKVNSEHYPMWDAEHYSRTARRGNGVRRDKRPQWITPASKGHTMITQYTDPHDPSRTVKVTAVHRDVGTIPNVTPAGHTPTLLEALGVPAHSTWQSYCNAISRYIAGKMDYKSMIAVWSRRLPNGRAS